jgi:hypothetical protein
MVIMGMCILGGSVCGGRCVGNTADRQPQIYGSLM